uniref:Uncharacterized protein n=1 Tax=Parascaris univalens TaxID=6257 RepID=A0A915CJX6_PARUN
MAGDQFDGSQWRSDGSQWREITFVRFAVAFGRFAMAGDHVRTVRSGVRTVRNGGRSRRTVRSGVRRRMREILRTVRNGAEIYVRTPLGRRSLISTITAIKRGHEMANEESKESNEELDASGLALVDIIQYTLIYSWLTHHFS